MGRVHPQRGSMMTTRPEGPRVMGEAGDSLSPPSLYCTLSPPLVYKREAMGPWQWGSLFSTSQRQLPRDTTLPVSTLPWGHLAPRAHLPESQGRNHFLTVRKATRRGHDNPLRDSVIHQEVGGCTH